MATVTLGSATRAAHGSSLARVARQLFHATILVAAILGSLLLLAALLAASAGGDAEAVVLAALGVGLLAYGALAGLAARWGASWALLVVGLLVPVAGLVALVVLRPRPARRAARGPRERLDR